MPASAKTAVRRAAVLQDRLSPAPAGVTILIYHRVGGRTPISVDLPTALFDEQMAFLAERCRVLSLTDAAELLDAGEAPIDDRPHVAVTFDDGTADFVDEALPLLERHGVPATYYLATDFIDRQQPFPDEGAPMTWEAAKEIVASGLVDIGSHTHTHALLDRIPPAEAAHELDRSIAVIETHLGVTPQHFAYPKALLGSPQNEHEVRSRFRTATIGRTRPNPWEGSDLHRLTRSPIQVSDGMDFFERKVRGGMRLENDVRDLVNRWRYRGATR
jgi:peptidoglycan/xylan/chitin deacetylase (PgdA/CDA1 family)